MPKCPDCGMAWGGEATVPTRCLVCRCRPPGAPVPAGLQPSPWAAAPPAIPQQPGAPAPMQAAQTAMEKFGDAMKAVGNTASQAAQNMAGAFKGYLQPDPVPVPWVASGATVAGSDLQHGQDTLDEGARICTCDHWQQDHDRLGCTECGTCDAFVLQAAADAIEEVGSLHPGDFNAVMHHVRLKDGRRVALDDIRDAGVVLTRRAKAAQAAAAPQHRRGMRLRGISDKKGNGT